MQKILPVKSIRVNSQSGQSIISLQESELKREALEVARQEFLRADSVCSYEISPLLTQMTLAHQTGSTGALITAHNSVKLDWLDFKIFGRSAHEVVKDVLNLDPSLFTDSGRGMRGFPCMIEYQSIKVLYDVHRPERGVKVLLSGQGLDEVGRDALELLTIAFDGWDGKKQVVSRLDLAVDDREGVLNKCVIEHAMKNGRCVSPFATFRPLHLEYDLSTGDLLNTGWSWRLGSTGGDRFLRIYDKQLEQLSKGLGDPGHWLRFELQARKGCAMSLAKELLFSGFEGAGAILRGVCDFRDNDNDVSTRRTPSAWWLDFVGNLEPVKTGVKRITKSLDQKLAWLSRAASKTLAQVAVVFGSQEIGRLLEMGKAKINLSELRLLAGDITEGVMYDFKPRSVNRLPFFYPEKEMLSPF